MITFCRVLSVARVLLGELTNQIIILLSGLMTCCKYRQSFGLKQSQFASRKCSWRTKYIILNSYGEGVGHAFKKIINMPLRTTGRSFRIYGYPEVAMVLIR